MLKDKTPSNHFAMFGIWLNNSRVKVTMTSIIHGKEITITIAITTSFGTKVKVISFIEVAD